MRGSLHRPARPKPPGPGPVYSGEPLRDEIAWPSATDEPLEGRIPGQRVTSARVTRDAGAAESLAANTGRHAMKRALRVMPAIAAIAASTLLIAAEKAGDEEYAKPQMSLIVIEHVKPSMTKQYEETVAEMCALLTEHGADPAKVSFFTMTGPETGYLYIMPLADGFNSMQPMRENWMTAITSIGQERWMELAREAYECVDSRAMIHSVYREDLSYVPNGAEEGPDVAKFYQYDFLYVRPHMEEEFAEVAQEWKTLYAKHGIESGWRVYQQITGEDLPVFVIGKPAKSEAAYHAMREKIGKKIGEEAKALSERSHAVLRRVESKGAHPRPDLSYPIRTDG
jgi:hypothetical protein